MKTVSFAGSSAVLGVADLNRAARMIARTAWVDDQDDVFQEIWIAFFRWPPQTMGLAVTMARQVRNRFSRRMQKHRHAELHEDIQWRSNDPTVDEAIVNAELAAVPPNVLRWALTGVDPDALPSKAEVHRLFMEGSNEH